MPKLKKLAVRRERSPCHEVPPLAEDDITFAAGLDCVVIGEKGGKLERWSLTTFELEKSAHPPFNEDIKLILMGHGSTGRWW